MGTEQIIILTIVGLAVVGLVAWILIFWEGKPALVQVPNNDIQETLVTVNGGYSPNTIVVQSGKPVRLNFYRIENSACSEQVIFPDFQKQATLRPYERVPVEFTPETPGKYDFQCAMGMLHGKLIVQ
jgi:plastocyanin domain-containing protein